MRRGLIPGLFLVLALCVGMVARAAEPSIVQPNATKWMPVSAGPMAGSEMAVLMGDPAKKAPYIMRFRVKDGTRFPMHYHGTVENVTVISGALLFGFGSKTMLLGPGAFISVPANTRHYSIAKGETVFEADAIGPRTMTLVPMKKM